MLGTLLNDRYRVDTKLGEGGMGIVYNAHDTLLDRAVAIKALSPLLVGEAGLKRLLREAQAAAKLAHPNIVAIYDVIDDGDARLIVMEYVEGRSLRELIPLPYREALEIASQVCLALEYAHAHGVVHRDIKPENIIITSNGNAKVMDFGLARSEGRSRLTQTGMIVGTVAYMAPEQALQGTADARSDLYALGCVLYELITGHPPFEADDPIAVITQHINVPPVAPRFHTPAIPLTLEAAILKLLAKDPGGRYRSAEELARALEGIRGTASRESEKAPVKVVGAELVQAVRRGVLIGRDEELRTLKSSLDEAASGEGRLALITGQAGTGKTRLVEELITYAHLRGILVLSAKSYEGGTPYEPIIRMLRDYLRISTAEQVREALGDYAADLARLAPEVRQKLGSLPESIPLPPDQERARLFESVTRLFTTLSKARPVLLSVDDFHLADPATVQLLRYLAPAVAGERLLLAVAYQSEEANRTAAFADVLRQLRRERYAVSMEVRPLTQQQVGELIQAMAKHPVAPVRFGGRIFEVTEGNPYFIDEVINALFEQGTLYIKNGQWSTDFDEGARYAEMPIPATIRAAIEARLSRLSETSRQVLTHASVLGRQFRLDALAQVTGKSEDELLDLLDQALAARLLREVLVSGEDRYEFTQSMVREVIYEGLSRHRRRRMHLAAGEALEQISGTDRRERAGELADHFLEAGEEKRAIPYCVMAAEHAEALFAHDDAIRRLETARELLEDAGNTEEAVRVVEALGEPYLHTGQTQKSIECYQQALRHYETQNLRAKVAQLRRKVGHAYQITWEFATAIPILEQALQEYGDEASRDVPKLYLDLARVYNFTGQPERGMSLGRKALERAEADGATDEMAMAHCEIGMAHAHLMQMSDAEGRYREAIRLGGQTRSFLGKFAVRRAINNLAVIEALRDNLRAEADARKKSLELTEEVRDQFWIAWALVNVGTALWRLGDWEGARAYYDRVLALGERAGTSLRDAASFRKLLDEDWEGFLEARRVVVAAAEQRGDAQRALMGFTFMAEAAVMLGRYREAEDYARRGLDVKFPSPSWSWPWVLYYLSESLARQGRLDEAASACDQAEANIRAIGGTGAWGALHHLRGIIDAARGHRVEAERHFHEGIAIYEEFPHPYQQARIFEDLGVLQASQDIGKASEAYAHALSIFERLGAQRSVSRIRKTTEQLQMGRP